MNAWKITLRKTLRAALGLLVCSIGSYCTIVADVGLAPWDALFMGVSEHLPVSYGTVSVTCGLIVVVVDLLMHEKIGVGMLLDAFMVGKVIDLLRYLDVLAQPTSYAMRVGLMLLGITILCCGLLRDTPRFSERAAPDNLCLCKSQPAEKPSAHSSIKVYITYANRREDYKRQHQIYMR